MMTPAQRARLEDVVGNSQPIYDSDPIFTVVEELLEEAGGRIQRARDAIRLMEMLQVGARNAGCRTPQDFHQLLEGALTEARLVVSNAEQQRTKGGLVL